MKEPDTKLLRAYSGDYALLKELSKRLDITMAEALNRAITENLTVLKMASKSPQNNRQARPGKLPS